MNKKIILLVSIMVIINCIFGLCMNKCYAGDVSDVIKGGDKFIKAGKNINYVKVFKF